MHAQHLTRHGLAAYHQLAPVVLRLGIGLTFFFAGLGKVLGGVDNVARFFARLGIPLPGLMGPLIAYLELLGGLALLGGGLTRLVSLLFLCIWPWPCCSLVCHARLRRSISRPASAPCGWRSCCCSDRPP